MKPRMLDFVWRLAKCGVLLLLVTSALVAQQSPGPMPDPAVAPDSCLRRSIPVTFIKNTQTTPPLRLQDLQVAVKGDAASITSLVQDKHTRRVILLIDTSGSMGIKDVGPGWGIGLQTAKFAADAVPLEASVALGTFSEHLQISEFQDRASLMQQVLALGNQEPKHRTALYDAVSNASSQFKPPQFGDVIYLVTDGGDNQSSVRLPRLEDNLIARGVRVFVFFVNRNEPFHTPEESQGSIDMAELARTTGGGAISLLPCCTYKHYERMPSWSKEWFAKPEAASLAKSITDQVESPYRMQLLLTRPLSKPGKLSITLPRDQKAYTIVYPRRLEPCSKSTGQ